MLILTKRFQSVKVLTLSSLRDHLQTINTPGCKFKVEKVSGDRVIVGTKVPLTGKKFALPWCCRHIRRVTSTTSPAIQMSCWIRWNL